MRSGRRRIDDIRLLQVGREPFGLHSCEGVCALVGDFETDGAEENEADEADEWGTDLAWDAAGEVADGGGEF